MATIRSTSLDVDQLKDIAQRIKPEGKTWKRYESEKVADSVWAVPEFWDGRTSFATGALAISREPKGQRRSEVSNGRAEFPLASPWHLSENYLPPGVRFGQWMVDLSIERENDHCRFSNVVHEWILPRRLRIDPFFSISRDNSTSQLYQRYCQRPTRSGLLSASIELTVHQASISLPEDDNALLGGLLDFRRDRFLRSQKDESDRQSHSPKVRDAKFSDKGRYLLGTLQHFQSLPDAFNTLMHDFWRATLHSLGANPSHLDDRLEERFQDLLSKRLSSATGEWKVVDNRGRQTVVREALRIASQLRRPDRFIPYGKFLERYKDHVVRFMEENPQLQDENGSDFLSPNELDKSLQYLCERKILFQGHEWQCRQCFGRNWVSIDGLSKILVCNVCQNEELPPVSGDWKFKASSFIVEAYSDHGTEPAVWALWRLAERARNSFYFLPSTLIWFDRYSEDGVNDCEVDVIAVIDGEVIAVEATTSKSLKSDEIDKLIAFAEKVRPDKLFIVCGADNARGREQLSERIRRKLPIGVSVEVETYQKSGDHIDPYLPS